MGILRISKALTEDPTLGDFLKEAVEWIKNDCKADLIKTQQDIYGDIFYHFEGGNIPAGEQRFDVLCDTNNPDAPIFKII